MGPCRGQDDAVGHGQPQRVTAVGSGDGESAVEIDHHSAPHDCSGLNGAPGS